MAAGRLRHPPLGLSALVVLATAVPLTLLSWLGWRVLDQDRQLETQQARQRTELAADVAVAEMHRLVVADVQRMNAGDRDWPDGAAVVEFADGRSLVWPAGRSAYLPAPAASPEADPAVFAQAEALEFQRRDYPAAAAAYRALSESPRLEIRALALLGYARVLRLSGRSADALDTYGHLTGLDTLSVGETPVGLAARFARARMFEAAWRTDELRREAQSLDGDLRAGRWSLSGPVYALYGGDVARWLGRPGDKPTEPEALASAVAALWADRDRLPRAGHMMLQGHGRRFAAVWDRPGPPFRALVVSDAYARAHWLSAAARALAVHGARAELRESSLRANAPAETAAGAATVLRRAGDTGLPWDVFVTAASGVDGTGAVAQRRRLMLAGFLVVFVLTIAAGASMLRSVTREISVARLKSDFVAAVSHEFRTPLTSLRQFTDMLNTRTEPGPERRRICYEAQSRATARLTRLVESLLDFGRMEAGARRYQFDRHDGAALVERVVQDFRRDVEPSGSAVTCATDGPAPVEIDDEALARAIWNLLDNAVKYSPDEPSAAVRSERRGRQWAVAVADRGIGIPKSERAAILTAFHRGEEAMRRGIRGTGIGLSMVDQIVRAHGGTLAIDSEPGAGSTFTILLPLAE